MVVRESVSPLDRLNIGIPLEIIAMESGSLRYRNHNCGSLLIAQSQACECTQVIHIYFSRFSIPSCASPSNFCVRPLCAIIFLFFILQSECVLFVPLRTRTHTHTHRHDIAENSRSSQCILYVFVRCKNIALSLLYACLFVCLFSKHTHTHPKCSLERNNGKKIIMAHTLYGGRTSLCTHTRTYKRSHAHKYQRSQSHIIFGSKTNYIHHLYKYNITLSSRKYAMLLLLQRALRNRQRLRCSPHTRIEPYVPLYEPTHTHSEFMQWILALCDCVSTCLCVLCTYGISNITHFRHCVYASHEI